LDSLHHTRLAAVHGRFQPFHVGHLEYVMRAAELCDLLYIGVTNRDLPLISAPGVVSRSVYLDDAQQAQLFAVIQGSEDASVLAWAPWDTCAGFAADAWLAATGERLSSTWGGIPAPTALSTSIIIANGGNLTGALSVKPGSTPSSIPPATSK
jgi:cytidyltransferase-like protein